MSDLPTACELRIIQLVASGLSYKEVATTLGVRTDTVSKHMQDLYAKLHAFNSVHAFRLLIEQGYITLKATPIPVTTIEAIISRVTHEINAESARRC